MLHVRCAGCKSGLPIDQVHCWDRGDAFCGAKCAADGQGRETIGAERRRLNALAEIARARRANEEIDAVEELWLDRLAAADAIIGLTKGARRRKRSLSRQGEEFKERSDAARYRFETALAALMGDVMALAEETPSAVELAVKLARGVPGIAGQPETDAILAALEGALTGAEAPPALAIDMIDDRVRTVRHRDGVCTYRRERFQAKNAGLWLEKSFVAWSSFSMVEWIDGDVVLRDGSGAVQVSVHAPEPRTRDRVFGWAREEHPDLRDAQRAMTRMEAVSTPGCYLALALIIGGGICGLMKLFDAGSGWIIGAAVMTVLVAILPIVSGVRRVARPPIVHQLVKDGARATASPRELEAPLSGAA